MVSIQFLCDLVYTISEGYASEIFDKIGKIFENYISYKNRKLFETSFVSKPKKMKVCNCQLSYCSSLTSKEKAVPMGYKPSDTASTLAVFFLIEVRPD